MLRLTGTVESVSLIENVIDNIDYCIIKIDFDELKVFYDFTELNQFVNKRVEYTTRPDIYKGDAIIVVCELVEISTVQLVPTVENVKLVPEGTTRTGCNFIAKELRYGEFYPCLRAILSRYTLGASAKTKWVDYTMIDMESKEFNLRQFIKGVEGCIDVEKTIDSMIGCYVEFDIKVTGYGFQTAEINSISRMVELSPEVEVAKEVVKNTIQQDTGLISYEKSNNIVSILERIIDGEPGYALVRIASELYIINAIDAITTNLDIRAMRRAAICSRACLLPKVTKWSKAMLNTNRVLRCKELKEDRELMLILDVLSEESLSDTRQMYIKIRGLVNDIINIRRGVVDEKIINNYNSIIRDFNGLL